MLEHLLYSCNPALSDYHEFVLLRNALRDGCFPSDHELKEAVHMWLASGQKHFSLKAYKSMCNSGPGMFKYDAAVSSAMLFSQ